jgi:hypothetical protein
MGAIRIFQTVSIGTPVNRGKEEDRNLIGLRPSSLSSPSEVGD